MSHRHACRRGTVAGRSPSTTARSARAAWLAGVVAGLSWGMAWAVDAASPVDLLTVTDLTAKEAAAIRGQQAAKPPLAGSSDAQFDVAFKAVGMTPEQIDRLRRDLSRLPRRVGSEGLALPALVEFLAETADPDWQRVANQWSQFLHLPAVQQLSADAARGLAGFGGSLRLPGVAVLEPPVAAALAGVRDLSLPGITEMPANVAAAWRGRNHPQGGRLRLTGLAEISVEALQSLAAYNGYLDLSGLKRLTPEMAKAIHAGAATEIWLDGLETLTPEAAAILLRPKPEGQFGTMFRFGGLKTFPPEVARLWAGVHTGLSLPGLAEISPAAARELVAFPGRLELGMRSLTPEVARLLAEGPSSLTLSGLESLPADVARELGREQEMLDLPALRRLDADAARAFLAEDDGLRRGSGERRGGGGFPSSHALLRLNGLESISGDTADALVQPDGPQIELRGIVRLSPEAAQGLAAVTMWDGSLPRLGSLSRGAAQALATRRGPLEFRGLIALDPDAALALGRHTDALELGLRELPEDVARGLWRHRGSLKLPAVESLAPESAAWLGRHRGTELVIPGVKSLSMETARALADCPSFNGQFLGITDLSGPDADAVVRAMARAPGYLSLPHLRTVSPQALAALRERPQTGLPLDKDIRVIARPPAKRPGGR
jgi:hypothetical protein